MTDMLKKIAIIAVLGLLVISEYSLLFILGCYNYPEDGALREWKDAEFHIFLALSLIAASCTGVYLLYKVKSILTAVIGSLLSAFLTPLIAFVVLMMLPKFVQHWVYGVIYLWYIVWLIVPGYLTALLMSRLK